MQICQHHWKMIRDGVEARGMSHLIKSGEENLANAVDELEGGRSINDPTKFDPLASAAWHIYGVGVQNLGMRAMVVEKDDAGNDVHICPLCEARKDFDLHNTATGTCGDPRCGIKVEPGAKPWDELLINDHCLDKMREYAIEKGLIVRPS